MALTLHHISPEIERRLRLSVSRLLRQRKVHLPKHQEAKHFTMHILEQYMLRGIESSKVHLSPPEGYRVLIGHQRDIFLAIDFHIKNNQFRYTYALHGPALDDFVMAINHLNQLYLEQKTEHRLALISFFLSGHPYLASYSPERTDLYTYQDETLQKITHRQLLASSNKIKKSHHQSPELHP